jgi:MFS family permease
VAANVPVRTVADLGRRQLRRAIFASAIGSVIEWYDFLLYATVAGLYLGRLFFPGTNPFLSTLAAYTTYFVGFAARPLGAFLFGHFGDRIGRKAALIVTLALMGVATFLVGLVPTYAQIGIWGGVILVVLRVLQGVAVGGEWGGAALLTVEWAPAERRGFAGAFAQIGIPGGLALGFILLQVSTLTLGQASYWGWRAPFLISVVLLLVGLYVRLGVLDTPAFTRLRDEGRIERLPSLQVLRTSLGTVLLTTLAKSGQFGPAVLNTVFITFYLTTVLKNPQRLSLLYAAIASGVSVVTILFWGYLSDIVGRKRLYLIGAAATLLFGVPYYLLLDTRLPLLMLGSMIVMGTINDTMNGPQAAFFAEVFTRRFRYSGASLGFQLAALTVGGPAPILATALINGYHSSLPIGLFIAACGAVALVAAALLPDRFRQDLSVEYDEPPATVTAPRLVSG